MYLIYTVTLAVLIIILILLWKEERRLGKNITHGLANKFWILRERRKYVRFKKETKIRYHLLHKPSAFTQSKTADISRKGLSLLTYEKLRSKDWLNLEIELPNFSRPVRLTGQVVWTKDLQKQDDQGRRLFYVGIKFSKIKPEFEAMLLTHLNTLKRSDT